MSCSRMPQEDAKGDIRTIQERSLHSALKTWYSVPGDRLEAMVDGYLVDIARGQLLIEIQTRNFAALKHKLVNLLRNHELRVVLPISVEKWIMIVAADKRTCIRRRRSPKRGRREDVFRELVSFPELVRNPRFSLELVMIREEELRCRTPPRGRFRKSWSTVDRHLLGISDRILLSSPDDFLSLLPPTLKSPFTTRELSEALKIPIGLAQKMVYCLRDIGAIGIVGKKVKSRLYARL